MYPLFYPHFLASAATPALEAQLGNRRWCSAPRQRALFDGAMDGDTAAIEEQIAKTAGQTSRLQSAG